MPEPRADRALAAAPRVTIRTGKEMGEAARQRRVRAGLKMPEGMPVEIRNGLPEFKPYVWKGDPDA